MRILIDGSNLLHKLYHVAPADRVLDQFVAQLQCLAQSFAAAEIQIALDREGPSWRRDLWPGYKGGRDAKPADLSRILQAAPERILRAGYECDAVPGFEADDLIATWAQQAKQDDQRCAIVSSDKDLYQCLHAQQTVILRGFKTSRGVLLEDGMLWFNHSDFERKYRLHPTEWPTFRALVGDPSDSMAGVPGIGESAAIGLLQRFSSIDAIWDGIRGFANIPLSQRQLVAFRACYRSGDLAKWVKIHTLVTNVPLAGEG